MDKLNRNIIRLIAYISDISLICRKFQENPTPENGEEIVKIIENSEIFLLKVKENIVRIVNSIEESEIDGIKTDNGFLINFNNKESKNGKR